MKKPVLILIAIVYVASIVVISIFGLKTVIYNEIIPVKHIQCINQTDNISQVVEENNKKLIKVRFTEPGDKSNLTGTKLQILWRVLPDNASNKSIKFEYREDPQSFEFIRNKRGEELGLIIFKRKVVLNIKIVATDGSRVNDEFTVWVY